MKTVSKYVKAIIFDMDNTIIQTERIWYSATETTLQKFGFSSFSPEQRKVLDSLSGVGVLEAWLKIKESFPLSLDAHTLAQHTIHHANNEFKKGVDFVRGFELFHAELITHNIRNGIATNADDESINHLNSIMQLDRYFGDHVYGISHVQNKAKPDPSIFLHVAKQLGVQPEECIVFEDSVCGFQAAHAAGMKCIAIKHDGNSEHRHHAYEAIDDYTQAIEALHNLTGKYREPIT